MASSQQEQSPLVTNQGHPQGSQNDPGFVEQGNRNSTAAQQPTTYMNLAWFAAAVCVMILSILGLLMSIINLKLLDTLQYFYLLVFGTVLAVLDTPIFSNIRLVPDLRLAISRYANVLMRVTGKGLVLLFVGSALWMTIWANEEDGNTVFRWLSFLPALLVILIGIGSIAVGVMKSANLDKVRTSIRQDGFPQGANNEEAVRSVVTDIYNKYAHVQPEVGMTKQEFNQMAKHYRGVEFQDQDLKLIFVALASHPRRENLTQDDLTDWVYGVIVFL